MALLAQAPGGETPVLSGRSRILVPADAPEELILERALADSKIQAAIRGKQIVKKIVVPGKLVNIVVR